jgi:hypothetical protein
MSERYEVQPYVDNLGGRRGLAVYDRRQRLFVTVPNLSRSQCERAIAVLERHDAGSDRPEGEE